MNKWYAIPVVAGALVIGGVAFAVNAEKGETISTEEAKTKALEAIPGQVKEIELERKQTGDVYEIEVESNGTEYELDLDAVTGEVKKTEVNDQDDDRDALTEKRSADRDDDNDDEREDENTSSNQKLISQEQAVSTAMKSAKGTVTEVELDEDDYKIVYEIEIRDGQMEYKFEIDALTGEVLEFDQEREDD